MTSSGEDTDVEGDFTEPTAKPSKEDETSGPAAAVSLQIAGITPSPPATPQISKVPDRGRVGRLRTPEPNDTRLRLMPEPRGPAVPGQDSAGGRVIDRRPPSSEGRPTTPGKVSLMEVEDVNHDSQVPMPSVRTGKSSPPPPLPPTAG